MQNSCSLVPPPDSPLENATDPSGAPPEATLVYDGDCGFCARTVRHLRWHTGPSLEIVPYQASLERFPDTPAEEFAEAVHMFEANGRKSRGAEAGLRALARLPGWSLPLWLYLNVALLRVICDWGYRCIAVNRFRISRLTVGLFGTAPLRRGQTLNRRAFELALGGAAVTAGFQLYSGTASASDAPVPTWTFVLGGLSALALLLGLAPKLALYLIPLPLLLIPVSITITGSSNSTEELLLEALLYAALFAAPAWTARRAEQVEPSVFGLIVLRFLTLRVMIDWIPWTIGDRDVIPQALAWIPWICPLLVFGPRRLRCLGAAFLATSQVVFALNHGPQWENLFVLALAITLLDDQVWMSVAPDRLRERWLARLPLFRASLHRRPFQVFLSIVATVLLVLFSILRYLSTHLEFSSTLLR